MVGHAHGANLPRAVGHGGRGRPPACGTRWKGASGFILDYARQSVFVLELTRGMDRLEKDWRDKEDIKIAAYHTMQLYLEQHFPGFKVRQITMVVGVVGSVVETQWQQQLHDSGLDAKHIDRVLEAAIRSAVVALELTLTARRQARDALGGVEGGISPHPSQRSLLPAQ